MGVAIRLLLTLLGVVSSTLDEAIETNDAAAIRAALDQCSNACIDAVGGNGMTAFQTAVLAGKFRAARALHVAGADVSIGDRDGYTAMHVAALRGDPRIVEWCIKLGLEKSPMAKDGFTPLHRACWGGEKRHTDTVWKFLDAGVLPNEPAADGQTPLAMAGSENTRRLLQEAVSELPRRR